MNNEDNTERMLTLITAAADSSATELQLGDLDWDPTTLPRQIEQLQSLESLSVRAAKLTDFSPLSQLPSLRSLTINSVRDADLSPISRLTELRNLEVTGDGVTNVDFLAGLTQLETLHIQGPVFSWEPIGSLVHLKELDLQSDNQSDISPLASLINLRRLSLTDGEVSDLTPLSSLSELEVLEFYWGYIEEIGPVGELSKLRKLTLQAAYELTDLSPVLGLAHLEELDLTDCESISDEQIVSVQEALPSCHVTQ